MVRETPRRDNASPPALARFQTLRSVLLPEGRLHRERKVRPIAKSQANTVKHIQNVLRACRQTLRNAKQVHEVEQGSPPHVPQVRLRREVSQLFVLPCLTPCTCFLFKGLPTGTQHFLLWFSSCWLDFLRLAWLSISAVTKVRGTSSYIRLKRI